MSDRDLCAALDALPSTLRHMLAVTLAEKRDDAVDRGDDALAAVYNAIAALAVESEDIERAKFAAMARELRWAPATLVVDDDDEGPDPTP
jgi:hypothetical protein